MNKFTVFYSDETSFSGDPFKSEWMNIDITKQIIKLEYMLGNYCVVMKGYKQFNHLLECVGLGQKGITRILLMGRTNDNTEIIVIDLKKNEIYKEFKPLYQEYGNQILNGWQKGILLMGRTNDNTEIIVIDLKKNKIYKEFKSLFLNGWQKGMMMKPKLTMKKLKE